MWQRDWGSFSVRNIFTSLETRAMNEFHCLWHFHAYDGIRDILLIITNLWGFLMWRNQTNCIYFFLDTILFAKLLENTLWCISRNTYKHLIYMQQAEGLSRYFTRLFGFSEGFFSSSPMLWSLFGLLLCKVFEAINENCRKLIIL